LISASTRRRGFIHHPRGKAFQEVLEALQVLGRKLVFHIGSFQYFVEAPEPNLARVFIDLKRKMPGSHAGRPVSFKVKRWSSQNGYEERSRLFGRLHKVRREKVPDLRRLQLLVKIENHPEDVGFPHDAIDRAAGPGTRRRPFRRRINDPFHSSIMDQYAANYANDANRSVRAIRVIGGSLSLL